MGTSVALALGLVLVIEGVLPLVAPREWRAVMTRIIALADGQLRFCGLALLVTGGMLVFAAR